MTDECGTSQITRVLERTDNERQNEDERHKHKERTKPAEDGVVHKIGNNTFWHHGRYCGSHGDYQRLNTVHQRSRPCEYRLKK